MLKPEDLLAARLIDAGELSRSVQTVEPLEAIRLETGKGGLLSLLVARGTLSPREAGSVRDGVEGLKRQRELKLYVLQLASTGLRGDAIRATLGAVGAGADSQALGNALVSAGLIDADSERRLRASSSAQLAEDLKGILASYRPPSRDSEDRLGDEDETVELTPAERTKMLDDIAETQDSKQSEDSKETSRLTPVEMSELAEITRAAVFADLAKQRRASSPQFQTPDWIDTKDPRVGDQIGPFAVLGRIGAGSMGVVYLAWQPEYAARPVALKLLPADANADAQGRFKREILANGFFSHENALDIYDADLRPGGEGYLAMEFFDGRNLGELLRKGPLSPDVAVSVTADVLAALAAAHAAGIVHRDVKPDNVLVSKDGSTRLMDFGIALLRDLGEFKSQVFETFGGAITGTPEYVSPEQAGGLAVGTRSDIYSTGVLLYQVLAGRLPFESETPHGFINCHMLEDPLPLEEANPRTAHLPRQLHDLVNRMLDKDEEVRPDADEAAETLRLLLAQLSGRSR